MRFMRWKVMAEGRVAFTDWLQNVDLPQPPNPYDAKVDGNSHRAWQDGWDEEARMNDE